MKKQPITINGKYYSSVSEAAEELNVSYQTITTRIHRSKSYDLTIDLKKYDEITNPEYLKTIDFSKKYTLDETSEHLYQLGLTKDKVTRMRIQQIEKEAIRKLKKLLGPLIRETK